VDAARSDEQVARVNREDVERRWAAARAGAEGAFAALDRAGRGFDSGWFSNVEQAVRAAEARFRLGEGTLAELLDSRRARLQALDDYHAWQSEWWLARVEVARLTGTMPSADLICTDPYREGN